MNRAVFLCLRLIVLMATMRCTAFATGPDTFSPVVSFQYLDSLDEPGSNTQITSPVVSFLYEEWAGDDVLALKTSAPVSYFYNSAPAITLQPVSQIVKVGTNVTFTALAAGPAPLSYQWRFNGANIAGASNSSVTFNNVPLSYTGKYSVAVTNGAGTTISNDAALTVYSGPAAPRPNVPTQVTATQALSSAQASKLAPPVSTQLKWFNPATLSFDPVPQQSWVPKETVVLTHGYLAYPGTAGDQNWPYTMAKALVNAHNDVNIFAWDWSGVASISIDPSVPSIHVVDQGAALGVALMDALGNSYTKPIHFIGHSLGTGVNCAAANYIHGDTRPIGDSRTQVYSPARTHMTLLDEAELVTGLKDIHVLWDSIYAGVDESALYDGVQYAKNFQMMVIPSRYGWIDNYITGFGLPHAEAVNVFLWRGVYLTNILTFGQHGYAYQWYQDTIASQPFPNTAGIGWYLETNTLASTPVPPLFYLQSLNPLDTNDTVYSVSLSPGSPNSVGVYAAKKLYESLYSVGTTVQTAYLDEIQVTGNAVASFAESFSTPRRQPVYLDMAGSTPAFFTAPGQTNIQANWDLSFSLSAGSLQPQQLNIPFRAETASASGADSSALASMTTGDAAHAVYTIMPIHVPLEAVGMSFEYQISNAAVDDFMTTGIGTGSLFSLEAKYVQDGVWNATPVFQIGDYRNQDVQFVFALLGTSGPPAGTLAIRNIKFYVPPRPALTQQISGGQINVSWPISAQDWTMETSTDLKTWQPVIGAPLDSEYSHTMTFDLNGPARFYRLTK